jgi:hypothetical protein
MGGIYRPRAFEDKDELVIKIIMPNIEGSVHCFIQRFLGFVQRSVVPGRMFNVPIDIHTRHVGCTF